MMWDSTGFSLRQKVYFGRRSVYTEQAFHLVIHRGLDIREVACYLTASGFHIMIHVTFVLLVPEVLRVEERNGRCVPA